MLLKNSRLMMVMLVALSISCAKDTHDPVDGMFGMDAGMASDGVSAESDDGPEPEPGTDTGEPEPGTDTGEPEATDTGDTGDTDGATDSSTGEPSETEGMLPVSYAECPSGVADECPGDDTLCVTSDGPGYIDSEGNSFSVQYSYCTRQCETDDDCATDLDTSSSSCLEHFNGQKICTLDCSFGQSCPSGGYQCDGSACGIHGCTCSGDGCFEPECQTPP